MEDVDYMIHATNIFFWRYIGHRMNSTEFFQTKTHLPTYELL